MIEVSVKSILDIRQLLGGHKTVDIHIEDNSTVLGLLQTLTSIYGEALKARLFDENGQKRGEINLFINGRTILVLDGLETKLQSGDELLIFPPVGGG